MREQAFERRANRKRQNKNTVLSGVRAIQLQDRSVLENVLVVYYAISHSSPSVTT